MQENTPNAHHNEDITLKELILKIQEYGRELIRNWFLIGLITLPVLGYFVYKHINFIPTYRAELRFVVEGQGGGGGGLSSILGSFGVKKGGNLNPNKILEIGKSNKLFESIVFKTYAGDTTLADRLVDEYYLLNRISKEKEDGLELNFEHYMLQSIQDKRTYKKLKKLVWGMPGKRDEALSIFSFDEEKGIYSLNTRATDEKLSIFLTEEVYKGIKNFFEEEMFENQKKSAEILSSKMDSIDKQKRSKAYELARFEDRNKGLLFSENGVRRKLLNQEIQALNIAYSELLRNYEMTDINLRNWQPLFMKIDSPFSPLPKKSSSLIINMIYGIICGIFIGILIVLFRRIFKDIMN